MCVERTCPARELITEAALGHYISDIQGVASEKDKLYDECSGNGRSVDPLLLTIEDLKSLNARLLPKDREALVSSGDEHQYKGFP